MPQSQLQQYPSPPPPPPGVIYSQVPNVTYIQTQSSYPVSTTSGVYIPQYQPQYIQNQPTEPLPVVYGTIAVNTVDPINYVQPSAPSNQELEIINIQVPMDAKPGQTIYATKQNGQQIQVQLPYNIVPGSIIQA
eukprot:CAMPEP_0174819246 /NCGR_PEP_ID=MMETSP1107-20130205/2364_1 /TAXON_ID=36770 /ORGANISM="Paraphysomonas vestita, Strain GFlagA" /LENGTH=133 /DNA_ID=CAMNT_0016032377 /DNA_START=583 /DNA_END=981 /DNA_ORIENTATION=-